MRYKSTDCEERFSSNERLTPCVFSTMEQRIKELIQVFQHLSRHYIISQQKYKSIRFTRKQKYWISKEVAISCVCTNEV